uniref:helix-turn-helix domain-containing protein n=1 Tax=Eubacterium cellulosolvens TaxID=29322 RepID=UPI0004897790|nr:helix-turn-helix transcriptional regulator [[Eubacterium] cellulosolvens]
MADTLGERISALLKSTGMQQQTLAKIAGVTEASVSHYIKGDRIPRANVLSRIATALNTTSDYLMNGNSPASKNEIVYATRLIARNVHQMSKEEKIEIMSILFEKE